MSNPRPDNLQWADPTDVSNREASGLMVSEITASRQFNKKGSRGPLYVPYYRNSAHREPWMGERLDVSMRIAVAERPPNAVHKWNPNYKQEKHV